MTRERINGATTWLWLRRLSQGLWLGLWVLLFWQARHQQQLGPLPPDLFLSTDPLVTALTTAASRVWVPAMVGGLVLVGLTVLLGRFFCGWVCPLGTLLDGLASLWRRSAHARLDNDAALRRVKYYVLVAVAAAALVGSPLVYQLDPLVLLFRATTLGVAPSSPGSGMVLPTLLLVGVLGLTAVTARFWCRYLCPLGAFYGALARLSLLRRRLDGCNGCREPRRIASQDDGDAGTEPRTRRCQRTCTMGASHRAHGDPGECIRCMRCHAHCPAHAVAFAPQLPWPAAPRPVDPALDRRSFVVSLAAGAVVGGTAVQARAGRGDAPGAVRPPMVVDEEAFSALCVRCCECVRSCPTGALQPLLLEGGFAALWTPAIHPRIGGCRNDCNACSRVCPTGAVPSFGPAKQQKWTVRMGHVALETSRCVTYAEGATKSCLECVEVCPNEAIEVSDDPLPRRPRAVTYDRCVGCGLCETACRRIVIGQPALRLVAHGVGTPVALVRNSSPGGYEHAASGEVGHAGRRSAASAEPSTHHKRDSS